MEKDLDMKRTMIFKNKWHFCLLFLVCILSIFLLPSLIRRRIYKRDQSTINMTNEQIYNVFKASKLNIIDMGPIGPNEAPAEIEEDGLKFGIEKNGEIFTIYTSKQYTSETSALLAKEFNALDRRIGGFGYYISYGSSLIVIIPPEYTAITNMRLYIVGNEIFRILEKERRRTGVDQYQ